MRRLFLPSGLLACLVLAGCATNFPTTGPSREVVTQSSGTPAAAGVIQIVDVDDTITRRLLQQRSQRQFSEVLGNAPTPVRRIGAGDLVEVSVWEASPATLFASSPVDQRGLPQTSRAVTLPDQMVSAEGYISVPFAGRVRAAGRTLEEVQADVAAALKGKANQPEVLVRVTRNVASSVTVVGEVAQSSRVPLVPGADRLLDALAGAAGVRQPVNKMTIQVTRGRSAYSMPLQTIISDPSQNVTLQPGDVVTAMFQPLSFTALGATGKNEEINFESTGISLAQALARVGGLVDLRSDPQGVFIFRFEPRDALAWPKQPVGVTPEGMVPVIYRIDLRNPASFFVMQSFPMSNKDLLYVSNAPIAEVQKFLNVIFSVAYPVLTLITVTQ